jgi:toxin ParE1/3/4
MRGFLLSPAARADLDEIWDYTAARWSLDQAERYIREIISACQALADERAQGRAIPDIRAGYYKLAIQSHVLFYRITDTGIIDIIRILHQRMDIGGRL